MRADEQKSDMRRDTQGRGCNTILSPPVIEKVYHVDPAVTHGQQPGEPRENGRTDILSTSNPDL